MKEGLRKQQQLCTWMNYSGLNSVSASRYTAPISRGLFSSSNSLGEKAQTNRTTLEYIISILPRTKGKLWQKCAYVEERGTESGLSLSNCSREELEEFHTNAWGRRAN